MFELNTYSLAQKHKVQFQFLGLFIIAGIWLLGLTIFVWRIRSIFNNLTKEVKNESLIKILEKIVGRLKKDTEEIEDIKRDLKGVKELDRLHIQKIGLVRFNPFRETGGDHSFSIALLDANGTGLILTGIHTRERTRIYTKAVRNGVGEFKLSEEEEKALIKAQKSK